MKLRLNVSAVGPDNKHHVKFLLLIEPQSLRTELMSRIEKQLQGGGVAARIKLLLNAQGAILPDEEIGDMLRDGDEITAELEDGEQVESYLTPQSVIGHGDSPTSPRARPDPNVQNLLWTNPLSGPPLVTDTRHNTVRSGPIETNHFGIEEHLMIENITPKLREFILSRFDDAQIITELHFQPNVDKFGGRKYYQATGPFVAMYMKPQVESARSPVEYNVAREDLVEFQKLVGTNIDQIQISIDHLQATHAALKALLTKGLASTDATHVMLPYKYQTWDEVDGILIEAKQPMIADMNCHCPCIVIDASGMRERLPFVKASLKRTMYQFIPEMEGFNLISALQNGPQSFGHQVIAPDTTNMSQADDWIDAIERKAAGTSTIRLHEAMRLALSYPEVDEIWVISGAVGLNDVVQNTALLQNIKSWNVRDIKINTISIDADSVGELLMRNMAVTNNGKFTMKRFDGSLNSRRRMVENLDPSMHAPKGQNKWSHLLEDFQKQRLTIGGQVRIVDIMTDEEKQREAFWKQEWKCANKLLHESKPKKLPNYSNSQYSVRCGGGYVYQGDQQEFEEEELDHIFDVLPNPGVQRTQRTVAQAMQHQAGNPWEQNRSSAVEANKRARNFQNRLNPRNRPDRDDRSEPRRVPQRRVKSHSPAGQRVQRERQINRETFWKDEEKSVNRMIQQQKPRKPQYIRTGGGYSQPLQEEEPKWSVPIYPLPNPFDRVKPAPVKAKSTPQVAPVRAPAPVPSGTEESVRPTARSMESNSDKYERSKSF